MVSWENWGREGGREEEGLDSPMSSKLLDSEDSMLIDDTLPLEE